MSRVRPIVLVLASLAILLGITALAAPALRVGGLRTAPRVQEPLPFDHAAHRDIFARKDLTCVTCHPVGLRTQAGAPTQDVPTPRSSCHGCHLGTFKGAPRKADPTCGTCHPDRTELVPKDHGVGWQEAHGAEARARGRTCTACHDTSACVDCHEGRGALSRTPHPPGFRATHGVEARLDPAKCSSCHVEDTCTACHREGRTPW